MTTKRKSRTSRVEDRKAWETNQPSPALTLVGKKPESALTLVAAR